MATDNESLPTPQFPEEVPQTMAEMFAVLKARMDAGFYEVIKEMREMEARLDEEARQRYVDLRQRISKLQLNENVADEHYELLTREINQLKNHSANWKTKLSRP